MLAIASALALGIAEQAFAQTFPASVNLGSLNGTDGFRLDGVSPYDRSGRSVSAAGDVNGDGFADVIIGALAANPNGQDSGSSYVVFGKNTPFAATLALSTLNGSNGFRIDGRAENEIAGNSVSSAGDINGDGMGDLIIGSLGATPHGSLSGSSYVLFGKSTPFTATLPLSSLNGTNGFRIDGVAPYDQSGCSVGAAGDVNGDGFDDIIVGAFLSNQGSGTTYVVFGKSTPFQASLELSSLDGTNGFRLDGVATYGQSGESVSTAGDINGDGRSDLIVGATGINSNGVSSGGAYVVFGQSSFAANPSLSNLFGGNGFRIDGVAAYDNAGDSVSAAGDVNGDGRDDLIVGAIGATPNGRLSGSSYVMFGKSTPFTATLGLSNLSGANGFRLDGVTAYDRSGHSVSDAGDINDDGFDDLIIGAYLADPNGYASGASYVVFGKGIPYPAIAALASLNGNNGFRLEGAKAVDRAGYSVGAAGDINGDGIDDLIIGAPDADSNNNNGAGSSYVVFGRNADRIYKAGFE